MSELETKAYTKQYYPDTWVILRLTNKETNEQSYRIFAEWKGGYISGNSWRMNSGITLCNKLSKDLLEFVSLSGNSYVCCTDNYGITAYGSSVVASYNETSSYVIEVLDYSNFQSVLNCGSMFIGC